MLELEKNFKVVPVIIPLPVLEAIVREFEHGDLHPTLKEEVNFILHNILEQSKSFSYYPSEVTQAVPPEFDPTDLIDYIVEQTGIDRMTVIKVLEAEDEYFSKT